MKRSKNILTSHQAFSDVMSGNNTIPPILVRLSFRVPPERIDEFEAIYQKEIKPFLLQRGLVESSENGRKTVEGVFNRLFEVKTLTEVREKAELLQGDPAWNAMLRSLGDTFGSTDADWP
jgi:hypothetical protein